MLSFFFLAIGCRRLALELIKLLGLDEYTRDTIPSGREDVSWSVISLVSIVARLCDPSSELSIAENFFRRTALSDLLGVSEKKIYENRLYRALDKLLSHKEKLGELFDLEYDLLLYDVTSTYFEGEAKKTVCRPTFSSAFLAYVLWKTLAGLCERAGLGHEPRRVLRDLAEIRVVDVVLPTRQGVEIRK